MITKDSVGYIAGPLEHTGQIGRPRKCKSAWEIEQNIRRAEDLFRKMSNLGFACICVHLQARYMMGECDREHWLWADQLLLKRCQFVVLSPGWRSSPGTLAEIELAFLMGIPVFNGHAKFMQRIELTRKMAGL